MILSIGEDTSGALTSISLKKILLSIIWTKARSESMKREEKNEVGERFFKSGTRKNKKHDDVRAVTIIEADSY